MTWVEFFRELAKHRGTFEIGGESKLIMDKTGYCPIMAVYNRKYQERAGNGWYIAAGREMQMNEKLVTAIVKAADNSKKQSKKVRRKLLQTLGLEETG